MKIIDLIEYDISNYKEASMFIITCKCSFKCDKENGTKICQNSHLVKSKAIEIDDADIVNRYINNPLTSAIVFGGLEPFDQFQELYDLVKAFRTLTEDTIVVYTGYNEDEISKQTQKLADFRNIIIKYGRFIPNQNKHFDDILGVELASDNQYAKFLKKLKMKQSDDKELVATIEAALKKNKEQYGARYCPCSIERNEDTICPCKAFREQFTPGPCHCGKFEKMNKKQRKYLL